MFSVNLPHALPLFFANSAKPLPNAQSCTKPVGEGVAGKMIRRGWRSRGREIGAGDTCKRRATWGLNTESNTGGGPTSTTTPKTTRLEATPTPTPTTANTTDRQDRVTGLPGRQVTRSPVVTLTRSSVSKLVNLPYDPACLRRSPTDGRTDELCRWMDGWMKIIIFPVA